MSKTEGRHGCKPKCGMCHPEKRWKGQKRKSTERPAVRRKTQREKTE
jgi:hypothetical protein